MRGIGKSRPDEALRSVVKADEGRAWVSPGLAAALGAFVEGADDLVTDAGIVVYSAGSRVERNVTYEVADYAPEFVLVGDDSGGRGFLVRADDPDSGVFSSDLGDLDPAEFEIEAADLVSWIGMVRDDQRS
ncbi:hypothetical protein ACFT9I_16640 [Streptomyces sp. NPDC057137]|uniref:hypothetical protein n=1 Tax=Streptomyces sp. NPDC057137 TaxID=3346030 RepID=UPI00363BA8A9